jgi:hypothetical protein
MKMRAFTLTIAIIHATLENGHYICRTKDGDRILPLENGCCIIPPELASVVTPEMCWEYDIQLSAESSYMTEYLRQKMNEEFSFDGHRINLVCTNTKPRNRIMRFDAVQEVEIPFDFKYFSLTTLEEKQVYLADVLTEGIKILCDLKGWDFSLWERHLSKLRESGLCTEHTFPGKKSPNGKLTAKLYCVQTMTETTCYVDFYRGRKLLQRSFVRTGWADWIRCKTVQLDRVEWIDDHNVAVCNYNGTEVFYATVDDPTNQTSEPAEWNAQGKNSINGRPVPYGLPKEELFSLLSSESMSDFVVACEALSVLPDEDVCDRLGAYLTSPDKYRRLAVLKVIFRNPAAVKYLPALEEAILSEDPLFAENGLRAAYEHRLPVAESTILAVHRLIIWYPYALDLLSVSEGNYRALIEIFAACVSSLQQGITADILARKYADTHAAELFRLFSASTYPEVRRMAALLGLRFGFDLTALRNDPDGHVRRAASPDQNEGQILNENRKDR